MGPDNQPRKALNTEFESAFPQAAQFRNAEGYGGVYGPMFTGFCAAKEHQPANNAAMASLQSEHDVTLAVQHTGPMDEREREYHKGVAFGMQTCITKLSQSSVYLPVAQDVWKSYALMLRAVLARGYSSLASAAMCQTRDGEASWNAMGEALSIDVPDDGYSKHAVYKGSSKFAGDTTLGALLDKLRHARIETNELFGHTELYTARSDLLAYLSEVIDMYKVDVEQQVLAPLTQLCSDMQWRTDGDARVLTSRVQHHIRDMRASVKAHQALLAERPTVCVKPSIDTAGFRVLIEKFIAWRDNGMTGPNPYVEIVEYIDNFGKK